jgi:hypothetical protein
MRAVCANKTLNRICLQYKLQINATTHVFKRMLGFFRQTRAWLSFTHGHTIAIASWLVAALRMHGFAFDPTRNRSNWQQSRLSQRMTRTVPHDSSWAWDRHICTCYGTPCANDTRYRRALLPCIGRLYMLSICRLILTGALLGLSVPTKEHVLISSEYATTKPGIHFCLKKPRNFPAKINFAGFTYSVIRIVSSVLLHCNQQSGHFGSLWNTVVHSHSTWEPPRSLLRSSASGNQIRARLASVPVLTSRTAKSVPRGLYTQTRFNNWRAVWPEKWYVFCLLLMQFIILIIVLYLDPK